MRLTRIVISLSLLGSTLTAVETAPERVTKGNLVLENVPEVPAELAERTRQYQNVRAARFAAWDPAGGVFISTRFGNTAQLHQVAQPGAARTQLTFFEEPVGGCSLVPHTHGRKMILSRDTGGGEFYQLHLFDRDTGRATLLTDGKSRNGGPRWNEAGDAFVYTSTKRNGKDSDLYLAKASNPAEASLLLEVTGAWSPVKWSPDGTRLLLHETISATESRLHLLEVATGRVTPLNPRPEPVAHGSALWDKTGRSLFLATDEGDEFQRLKRLDLATGKQTILTPDLPWDVEELELSHDGKTLAFTVNEGGRSGLYLLSTADNSVKPVGNLPLGVVGGLDFSEDDKHLAFSLGTPQSGSDVFSLTLAGGEVRRWTFSEAGGLDPARFLAPQLVGFPTFDQAADGKPRRIPAWYYRPQTASADKKAPVLISIHGGPEGQSTAVFSSLAQFYTNEMGVAVIQPNVRGSSGYGKTWLGLDNGFRREDSVRDIGALLDWIATQPELDASRVAVMGGSYGGYMSQACMVHYHDRLRCGVSVVGISNFLTFLQNTQDYRRDLRRVEYGDERDPAMREFLQKISPLTRITEVDKPMLVVQGKNDPRVPYTEAEQVVAALRAKGANPWYVLGLDEGHGFSKKANSDAYTNILALFLQKYLLGGK